MLSKDIEENVGGYRETEKMVQKECPDNKVLLFCRLFKFANIQNAVMGVK
ncbi:hypothetical protein [Paenibacillus oralis]|nr:hypothetical protein [Paenibacillus oralis]